MNSPSSFASMLIAIIVLFSIPTSSWAFANVALSGSDNNSSECGLYRLPSAEASRASMANQSNSLNLKDRIWISVRQIDFSEASWWVAHSNDNSSDFPQPVISCTLLTLDKIPQITEAMEGADNCKQGVEVCELPTGVSAGGEVEYKSSIAPEEAKLIANEVSLIANKAVLQQQESGKYYLLQLFTTDENIGPQARIEFLDNTHFVEGKLIHLEKGQSINIPFTVRTFATFGKPANITLVAGAHASDSGLTFKMEPSPTFIIPERSTAKANLTVSASANALDGIYRFFIVGKNGWIHTCGDYADYVCPEIQVGNSTWEINTNGGAGLGGKAPPDWLKVDTETDQDVYSQGETIAFKSYIVNNGNSTVMLEGTRLVIDIGNATVYADPNSSTTALNILYTIDAYRYSGLANDTIVIPAHSKTLLARPFYWNQELAGSVTSEGPAMVTPGPAISTNPVSVQAGNYSVHTSLMGYDGAVIYDSKNIQITTAPYGDDIRIVSRPEVWVHEDIKYPLLLGAGAALAGVIAFLTLRRRK